ncbi:MAG: BrnA antitoxin family protein [Microcoleus sp. CSU_2_2]|nr:BrnA antitoxin family protein [Microcoleus sp. CSU_2_2]
MTISRKRLEELENIPESAIDTSDIPELDASFWEQAKLVEPLTKQAISLRVDSDVLDWFKNQGKGYQSLMNSVLRSYVEHHVKSSQ